MAAILALIVLLPLLSSSPDRVAPQTPEEAVSAEELARLVRATATALSRAEGTASALAASSADALLRSPRLGFFGGVEPPGRGFRLGAHLADLELALALAPGDEATARAVAERALEEMAVLLAETEGAEAFREEVLDLERRLGRPPDARDLGRREAREIVQGAGQLFDRRAVAFGAWVESGRLAAVAGAAEPLGDEPFVALGVAARGLPLDRKAVRQLDTVTEVFGRRDQRPLGPTDLDELRRAFETLLHVNGAIEPAS